MEVRKDSGHGNFYTAMRTFQRKLVLLGGIAVVVFAGNITAWAEPSPDALRQTIRDYIAYQEQRHGAFLILDERGEVSRRLELVRVHERVGKTGDYYYSCTDMNDKATGELLDLDFDISDMNSSLEVVEIRIHKDDGVARYTYDQDDNLIPVS